MATNSKIEWTTHTFNPWRGCTHVSPGCEHCYAETLAKRNPNTLGVWGEHGHRVIASEAYWKQPEKWSRDTEAAGERHRVFCASLADVFEDRPELHAPRLRLLDLIRRTPNLDWLLLTKRPENIMPLIRCCISMIRAGNDRYDETIGWATPWICGDPPANIWLGTSVEDQRRADERIPHLLATPAAVRFLSAEPLLGPIDLSRRLGYWVKHPCPRHAGRFQLECVSCNRNDRERVNLLHWIIAGGESGPGARPAHPDWFRSLRDQCVAAGVPYFFKQHGEWLAVSQMEPAMLDALDTDALHGRGAADVRTFPGESLMRVGKKAAGHLLDGQEWQQFPS